MDWSAEALIASRALVAVALGGLIGWERERHGREAGIRTYGAVALGACVFALVSLHVSADSNSHVIAAGVVTGVGFLGAGVIVREGGNTVGLTTAATLWSTASVGLAVGCGMVALAVLSAVLVLGLLAAHHLPGWQRLRQFPASDRDSAPTPTPKAVDEA